MHSITLKGPSFSFYCYTANEAKRLGLIDSYRKSGTYAPISTPFEQGEGMLLKAWIDRLPDAILVSNARYKITVYRPKTKLIPND